MEFTYQIGYIVYVKIYLITNLINNKMYVGQTKSTLKRRFNQHCEPKIKTAMGMAIQKYGRENFSIVILQDDITELDELNILEKKYIKDLGTMVPNGYNVEEGGKSFPMSEATKRKISIANKGRNVTWGYKVSEGAKKLWEDPEYRERQTKQRYKKRGKYREGITKKMLRKLVDMESFKKDYDDYMGLSNISEKYGISIPTIYRIIKREKFQKRGYKCNNKNK
jgi:group I intron endonuclease